MERGNLDPVTCFAACGVAVAAPWWLGTPGLVAVPAAVAWLSFEAVGARGRAVCSAFLCGAIASGGVTGMSSFFVVTVFRLAPLFSAPAFALCALLIGLWVWYLRHDVLTAAAARPIAERARHLAFANGTLAGIVAGMTAALLPLVP